MKGQVICGDGIQGILYTWVGPAPWDPPSPRMEAPKFGVRAVPSPSSHCSADSQPASLPDSEAFKDPPCSLPRLLSEVAVGEMPFLLSTKALGSPGCLGHQGPSPRGPGA